METQQFRFSGFNFRRAVIVYAACFAATAILTGICAYVFENVFEMRNANTIRYRLSFGLVLSASIVLAFTKFYGVFYKGIWRIIVKDDFIQIYFNNKLQNEFTPAEIKKIHIRAWFREENKRVYRWLNLYTEHRKVSIITGNTALINTATELDLEMFDELFSTLEVYTVKHEYVRINLKKWFNPDFVTNYCYLRN